MTRPLVPLLLAGCFCIPGVAFGSAPDLSRPPSSSDLAGVESSGGLAEFRNALGDALASQWHPSRKGTPGSSDQSAFGAWVDLYQWLDLLESDEAAVTRRWLSRHLSMTSEKTAQGENVQVTIHQPGTPLVRRYDELQQRATRQLSSDPAMLGRAMAELVAQPFVSRNGPLIGRLDPAFVSAMLKDPAFLNAWGNAVGEDDFAPKVLLNLESIWKAHPQDWKEYLNLALAISIVHDQPAPNWWPHRQVLQKDVPRKEIPPAEMFGTIVRAFREGKLRMDPRKLEARELKFVVDAPLKAEEFDSIRNTGTLAKEDPARAFASIRYDNARVAKNAYVWPWGDYSLERIRKRGGICVDQAYYAAVTGKALGIPTIFFAGFGKDGGHAWTGYLKGKDAWNLNVGRNEAGNYATGDGLDPQNWTPITDHDIAMLTLASRNPGERDAVRRDLVMAVNFRRRNDAGAEGRAIQSALARCPSNPLIWDAKEDWLVRTGSPAGELKAHHQDAIRQFAGYRDLKVQHEEALARVTSLNGETKAAEQISKKIVKENQGVRADLSADAAMRLITDRVEAGDVKGALNEYGRQLYLQGTTGGGNFFYRVTAPLSSLFVSKGRPDLARRVLVGGYNTLNPPKGSPVAQDFRRLWIAAGGKP